MHRVSDSFFLSKATVVSRDSFNIHANRGERDPVWKTFFWSTGGTLILAQITAALHERVFWLFYPSGRVNLRGGV